MEEYAFIGLGLIGGSIARAIRKVNPSAKITIFDHHAGEININKIGIKSGAELALEDGVANKVTGNIKDLSSADYIFLCAPVIKNIEYLKDLKPIIKESVIITDVGSVKNEIVTAAEELGLSSVFVGGHPMAGSEKTGYANSSDRLLENAYYIITPCHNGESIRKAQQLKELVASIHALPVILDSKSHDGTVATISHVPHLVACALVELVKKNDDPNETMRTLAAGGFKDITRIASSSPAMWRDICLSNSEAISNYLGELINSLSEIKNAVDEKSPEYITGLFNDAGTYRSTIPNSKGLLNRYYEIFVDLADEPGAIASIATLLAVNSINIKNIGIVHNREFEQGVLRIETYDEEAEKKAITILSDHAYKIYLRH